jgi:hypothetical protein
MSRGWGDLVRTICGGLALVVATLAVAVLLILFMAVAALAQQGCGPADQMMEALRSGYGEVLVGEGYAAAGIVQTYANAATGSFTVVVILPSGMACLVAAGEDWHAVEPAALGIDG